MLISRAGFAHAMLNNPRVWGVNGWEIIPALTARAGLAMVGGLGRDRLRASIRFDHPAKGGSRPVPVRQLVILGAALGISSLALSSLPLPAGGSVCRAEDAPGGLPPLTLTVGRGDTLVGLLVGAGVNRAETIDAIETLRPVFDPRKLKIAQSVSLELVAPESGRDGPKRLAGLHFRPDPAHVVGIARNPSGGFTAQREDVALSHRLVSVSATIRNSLFEAGSEAGVPVAVMLAVITTYSHDVDFQRDFQSGDHFDVLYEQDVTDAGEVARDGAVLYARLTLSGRELPIYRFQRRDGRTDYYNRQGESVRKALLKTPVDGARITSRFGLRNHPILGYSRMHRGIDFGAPTGTPVYAAGNGILEEAGRHSGYGNYVRIRHNNDIETAYGHLSRFAKGVHRGMRVEQGEVIAYVGSTGMATGPHLHYEVLRHGDQVNPLSIDLPVGQKLDGRDLDAFRAVAAEADRAFADGLRTLALASAKPADVCTSSGGMC